MTGDARRLSALAAICDTFAPGGDGLPAASSIGVPELVAEHIAGLPRAAERRQLEALLSTFDGRALTAIAGGGPRRFSSLPQPARERVLRSWGSSRLWQRRNAFNALRKLALVTYATLPERARPLWDEIGYPGPIGPVADPTPSPIVPVPVYADVTLDCDVVVVGSGAGGGVAAGVLAAAGLEVIVVEAGSHLTAADFDGAERTGLMRSYFEAGGAQTHDGLVALLAGRALGGGTVVNYTTSLATPPEVRAEWASYGAAACAGPAFDDSVRRVSERLSVTTAEGAPSTRDRIMGRGCEALGWHVAAMPRNVRGCDQGTSCGYCGYGCRLGAKQSMERTYLADAHGAGARILVETRVERITTAAGVATGVTGRTADGHGVAIRARAVVAACGALQTPVLLRRSGLVNPQIGRGLRLHPVIGVYGLFDELVEPWTGAMQALYSDEFRDLDGGYGAKLETAPIHPSLAAAFLPWRSAADHRQLLGRLANLSLIGVVVRDRGAGEVRVSREGEPDVRYALSDHDRRHLQQGLAGAVRILAAAGATSIGTTQSAAPRCDPARPGAVDELIAEADACGYTAGRAYLASFHQMGTAAMGGSEASSAADPEGALWECPNVVVCDASTFPTASGVNPMLSVCTLADLNARALAARLVR